MGRTWSCTRFLGCSYEPNYARAASCTHAGIERIRNGNDGAWWQLRIGRVVLFVYLPNDQDHA